MIKTHKELADHIAGRRILHLNSLGKDSIVALEWLTKFARVEKVYSVFFNFMAEHPGDKRYLKYLEKRYPEVTFLLEPNPIELTHVMSGVFQYPTEVNTHRNKQEFNDFEMSSQIRELKAQYKCDYVCSGQSKYESFARASRFHREGILIKDTIYPLGMMTKENVITVIKQSGIKLHPQYKFVNSTADHPSYWKMRSLFIASPEFRDTVHSVYPLMVLDQFRNEELFK